MKTKLILGLILILSSVGLQAQDKGEIIIPLSDPGSRGSLKVDIKRGSIIVTGTDRKDVLINYQATESKHKDKDKMKDGLQKISSSAMDLEASERNNKVSIDSDSYSKGVILMIQIPKNFDLNLDTYNAGDIKVENITGEVILENYNGAIAAKGISGSLSANTYNGEITIELLKVTEGVPMSFTTYNGDVDVTFPASVKTELKLKSSRGEIYSGFDVTLAKSGPVKKTDSKSGTYKVYLDDWVRGKINGGGSEVVMKNYNGDIYIRKL